MSCRDAIALLGEDPGIALPPTDVVRLSSHLTRCRPCGVYFRTYRMTGRLLRRSAPDMRLPEDMKQRLCAYLLERLSWESRQ